MTELAYLADRYREKLKRYWAYWCVYENDPLIDLSSFSADNCVIHYETYYGNLWWLKDWTEVCYIEAKMYVLARDEGIDAAIMWKLAGYPGWHGG